MSVDRGSDAVRLRLRFPNRPETVHAIRHEVASVARACGLGDEAVQDVRLAVSEAATNAIVHANAESGADVAVRIEFADGELCVVIADQGTGMRSRSDSPGLGLGLPIISTLAQRMEVISPRADGGTELRMYFSSPGW